MEKEKSDELVKWLNKELERISHEIIAARARKQYTASDRLQGEADAYLRVLKRLQSE